MQRATGASHQVWHRSPRTVAMSKRSDVRLGKDNERRLAKWYGWRKVGQFSDAVDLLGADIKVQSKATRHHIPAALADMTYGPGAVYRMDIAPVYVTEPLGKMAGLYPDRIPVLVRSFIHRGRPTRDFVYLSARHWYALHGTFDEVNEGLCETAKGYVVMTGVQWLDIHGRETLNPPDRMA